MDSAATLQAPANQLAAWAWDNSNSVAGFLNKPNDPSTGLTYDGARSYDPATGQFTSPDPILTPRQPPGPQPLRLRLRLRQPRRQQRPHRAVDCSPGDPCGGGTPAPAPVDTHMGGLGGTGGQGAGTANTGDGGGGGGVPSCSPGDVKGGLCGPPENAGLGPPDRNRG